MKEKFYTAYVTVTIPVGLAFGRKLSRKAMRHAAIVNFLAHPALTYIEDLALYVDEIRFEPTKI